MTLYSPRDLPNSLQTDFKRWLKESRLAQNLTQIETAERSGVPLRSYIRMEQEGKGGLDAFFKVVMALRLGDEFRQMTQPQRKSEFKRLRARMKHVDHQDMPTQEPQLSKTDLDAIRGIRR